MKELTSASQALSDALANQKKLMEKMEAAKTAKEKGAILKLLQLTLKNVTAMKQRVEKLQTELTPAFRNSKTFNRSNASAKSTTAVSQGNKGNVPEEDQQQEQEQKRAKKRSSEMDDDSNSSGSDSETSSTAFDQRQVAAVKNPANEAENLQEEAEAAAAVAVEDDVAQAHNSSSRKRARHELSKEHSTESVESSSSSSTNSDSSHQPTKVSKVTTNAVLAASVSVFNDAEAEEIAEEMAEEEENDKQNEKEEDKADDPMGQMFEKEEDEEAVDS